MAPLPVLILGTIAGLATAAAGAEKSGTGPCRNGVLALIQYLDANQQGTADYADAFRGVTQTCGPGARSRKPPGATVFSEPRACRRLALRMLDTIEAGRMNSEAFARARNSFARDCSPPAKA